MSLPRTNPIHRLELPPTLKGILVDYDRAAVEFGRIVGAYPEGSTTATIGVALEELDGPAAQLVGYLAASDGLEVPGRIEVAVQRAIDAGEERGRPEELDPVRDVRTAAHLAWIHFCPWRSPDLQPNRRSSR